MQGRAGVTRDLLRVVQSCSPPLNPNHFILGPEVPATSSTKVKPPTHFLSHFDLLRQKSFCFTLAEKYVFILSLKAAKTHSNTYKSQLLILQIDQTGARGSSPRRHSQLELPSTSICDTAMPARWSLSATWACCRNGRVHTGQSCRRDLPQNARQGRASSVCKCTEHWEPERKMCDG